MAGGGQYTFMYTPVVGRGRGVLTRSFDQMAQGEVTPSVRGQPIGPDDFDDVPSTASVFYTCC